MLFKTIALFLCLFFTGPVSQIQAETSSLHDPGSSKTVLLLNSYHQGYSWTDEITRGVKETLSKSNVDLHIEYMDTKRQYNADFLEQVSHVLQQKSRGHTHDVIISSDNNAFDFLKKNGRQIYGDTPVVFCGVNYLETSDIEGFPNYTGVNEKMDIQGNLALIRKLHPDKNKVVVITDDTTSGRQIKKGIIRAAALAENSDLEIDLVYDATSDELVKKMKNLDEQTIVLFTIFARDKNDVFLGYEKGMKLVCDNTTVPVYAVMDFNPDLDVVGGYLTSGYDQGAIAAKKAMQILAGTPVSEVPIFWETPTRLRLDYRQLLRHGISLDLVPPDADILNRPESLYHDHKLLIWNAIILFCLLILALLGVTYGLLRSRRAEKVLKAREKWFKDVVDSMEGWIWEVDTTGRYTYCSEKVQRILGYSPGEIIRKSAFDLMKTDDAKRAEKEFNEIITQRKPAKDVETWNIHKDGQKLCILTNGVPIFDENGELKGYRGVDRDITVRKQIENQLKESEEQYRTYFEENLSGAYISDPDGHLIACNREYRRIFGFEDEQQALDTPIEKLSGRSKKKTGFLKLIKTQKQIIGFETSLKKIDGTTVHVFESASGVFDKKGSLKHIKGFLLDITEQKNLQTKLRQAQKMEAIGTLSGGIAHDFNNILSGIFGYSQLAQKNIEKTEKAKNYIDQIVEGAKRAAELIQQILTFSRQTEHKKHLLNISSVVKEALKLLRSSIPTTIEIRENIFSHAAVLADPIQIHQVIMNLCTNAYHAMRDTGGILTVELKEVEIVDEKAISDLILLPGRYLKLSVSDTGYGIEKEALKKIFDPYFTTKKPGEGTGLGLALVYGIVEDHGGGVRVESVPGQGSVFHVFLPVAEKKEKAQAEEEVSTPPLEGTERVMVVDDEKGILTSTRDVLEYYGYKVSIFEDGEQAFKDFQEDPDQFDLILTDMTMPRMTGYELSKEVLKIRKDLPIILWTGYNENISEIKALKTGIKKFITKPVDSQTLIGSIREVLDEERK